MSFEGACNREKKEYAHGKQGACGTTMNCSFLCLVVYWGFLAFLLIVPAWGRLIKRPIGRSRNSGWGGRAFRYGGRSS